ncbi:probable methyltransferase-like protein 24 [Mytilus trossulus]|uniref:probable methyltransferase-like protein 24 n=1 Tax=Mytilus trossulus TaxID=6551 RepID=UPI003007750A
MHVCRIRRNIVCYIVLVLLLFCFVFILLRRAKREESFLEQKEIVIENEKCQLPSKVELNNLPHSKLASLYHEYISSLQFGCDNIIRLGEEADGGWDICDDTLYRPSTKCLVYSFGIDFDFSFDDAIAKKYGCELHSFDPSMKVKEGLRKHNVWFHPYAIGPNTRIQRGTHWPMFTLKDLKIKMNHQNRPLTAVKLDVEEWEMLALPNMISDGTLKSVKQLLIEFHITMRPEPDKQRYIRGLNILIDLYEQGFRIFWTKRNLFCRFTSLEEDIERTGCHELSFVNINTVSAVY